MTPDTIIVPEANGVNFRPHTIIEEIQRLFFPPVGTTKRDLEPEALEPSRASCEPERAASGTCAEVAEDWLTTRAHSS